MHPYSEGIDSTGTVVAYFDGGLIPDPRVERDDLGRTPDALSGEKFAVPRKEAHHDEAIAVACPGERVPQSR